MYSLSQTNVIAASSFSVFCNTNATFGNTLYCKQSRFSSNTKNLNPFPLLVVLRHCIIVFQSLFSVSTTLAHRYLLTSNFTLHKAKCSADYHFSIQYKPTLEIKFLFGSLDRKYQKINYHLKLSYNVS